MSEEDEYIEEFNEEILTTDLDQMFPTEPEKCNWCKFKFEHPERNLLCPTHDSPLLDKRMKGEM